MRSKLLILLALFVLPFTAPLSAAELRVAVASNFVSTAQALMDDYQRVSGDKVILLVGSTGKHAAQIQHGMDVDLFLAADAQRPMLLEQLGYGVKGSRFDYALGRLSLWSEDADLVDANGRVLTIGKFDKLAIANPRIAPYGKAAQEVLDSLKLKPALYSKLVRGDSIGQTFQFVSSANAQLGFVAYSQIKGLGRGSHWLVPSNMHSPILQQGIIIKPSRSVSRLVTFLLSESAQDFIQAQGYSQP